jgi:hypothetical protein
VPARRLRLRGASWRGRMRVRGHAEPGARPAREPPAPPRPAPHLQVAQLVPPHVSGRDNVVTQLTFFRPCRCCLRRCGLGAPPGRARVWGAAPACGRHPGAAVAARGRRRLGRCPLFIIPAAAGAAAGLLAAACRRGRRAGARRRRVGRRQDVPGVGVGAKRGAVVPRFQQLARGGRGPACARAGACACAARPACERLLLGGGGGGGAAAERVAAAAAAARVALPAAGGRRRRVRRPLPGAAVRAHAPARAQRRRGLAAAGCGGGGGRAEPRATRARRAGRPGTPLRSSCRHGHCCRPTIELAAANGAPRAHAGAGGLAGECGAPRC